MSTGMGPADPKKAKAKEVLAKIREAKEGVGNHSIAQAIMNVLAEVFGMSTEAKVLEAIPSLAGHPANEITDEELESMIELALANKITAEDIVSKVGEALNPTEEVDVFDAKPPAVLSQDEVDAMLSSLLDGAPEEPESPAADATEEPEEPPAPPEQPPVPPEQPPVPPEQPPATPEQPPAPFAMGWGEPKRSSFNWKSLWWLAAIVVAALVVSVSIRSCGKSKPDSTAPTATIVADCNYSFYTLEEGGKDIARRANGLMGQGCKALNLNGFDPKTACEYGADHIMRCKLPPQGTLVIDFNANVQWKDYGSEQFLPVAVIATAKK